MSPVWIHPSLRRISLNRVESRAGNTTQTAAKPIHIITYHELRELSYMGASVFHEEAIYPARSAGIPINIRNTNRPQDVGTWICPDDQTTDKHAYIAGIAGKKNFMSVNITFTNNRFKLNAVNIYISFFCNIIYLINYLWVNL